MAACAALEITKRPESVFWLNPGTFLARHGSDVPSESFVALSSAEDQGSLLVEHVEQASFGDMLSGPRDTLCSVGNQGRKLEQNGKQVSIGDTP